MGLVLNTILEFVIINRVEHVLIERECNTGLVRRHQIASFYRDYSTVRLLCEDEPNKKVMNFFEKGLTVRKL